MFAARRRSFPAIAGYDTAIMRERTRVHVLAYQADIGPVDMLAVKVAFHGFFQAGSAIATRSDKRQAVRPGTRTRDFVIIVSATSRQGKMAEKFTIAQRQAKNKLAMSGVEYMNGTRRAASWGLVPLLMAGLQACGGAEPPAAEAVNTVQCVEIPDGYYLFANGRFTPTTEDMAIDLPSPVSQREVVWINEFEDQLLQGGYDWLRLKAVGNVLFVSGDAETPGEREAALTAVRSAIAADRALTDRDLYIIDAVATPEATRPPGGLFMSLPPDPTLEACRTRADQLARSEQISYENEDSAISEASHRLLDAVAGLAMICSEFRLEIGVHTDARGAESFNRTRSQARADAIAAYLEGRGIEPGRLVAYGYGESRPIDPAQTSEAYALNRRVEFYFLREND